jgi:gamma-glutamyltranspeptidase/glutathione hydrolase
MKISAFMAAMLVLPCFTSSIMAQATPPLSACVGEVKAPACDAVRGDRADGWREQSRAEVMAPHAMVTTSQPLAAQAGLQIMLRGGNAIDAAVATAAVLNLVEPMNVGVAGDLFAMIYVAKKKNSTS